MSSGAKRWIRFVLRWGIAAAGIYWVLANMSLYDRVLVANPTDGWPVSVKLVTPAGEQDQTYSVIQGGARKTFSRTDLVARTDKQKVGLKVDGRVESFAVLGLKVSDDANRNHWPIIVAPPRNIFARYFNTHNAPARVVQPDSVVGEWSVDVPYPLIERGLLPMLHAARHEYLWAAVLIFPVTFIITSLRWYKLLQIAGIKITPGRAFIINMVGAFYNTFMPGSTGGDVLKAWYAARLAPERRTYAVMSVIVDRIIGLLALIILGGAMAGWLVYYTHAHPGGDSNQLVAKKCLQVAIGSLVIVIITAMGLLILYHPMLRKNSGLDLILALLPMQKQVAKALETMELYRRRRGTMFGALVMTFPVHATVIVSAMLAGFALNLPLRPWYYWVVVPVVVLAGSVPISPQGAGVMEFFAILLTRAQGATVSQAFALTMSIRIVQIIWNLTGGIFVFRGGYHAPTTRDQQAMDAAAPATG